MSKANVSYFQVRVVAVKPVLVVAVKPVLVFTAETISLKGRVEVELFVLRCSYDLCSKVHTSLHRRKQQKKVHIDNMGGPGPDPCPSHIHTVLAWLNIWKKS